MGIKQVIYFFGVEQSTFRSVRHRLIACAIGIQSFLAGSSPCEEGADPIAELHRAGVRAFKDGDFAASIRAWETARKEAQQLDQKRVLVTLLVNLAQAHHATGHQALAARALDEAVRLASELRDQALLLDLNALRAAIAPQRGSATSSRSIPASDRSSKTAGMTAEREWALLRLEELRDYLRSPQFPHPTLEEWVRATRFLQSTSNLRTTLSNFATPSAAIEFAQRNSSLTEANELLKEVEAALYDSDEVLPYPDDLAWVSNQVKLGAQLAIAYTRINPDKRDELLKDAYGLAASYNPDSGEEAVIEERVGAATMMVDLVPTLKEAKLDSRAIRALNRARQLVPEAPPSSAKRVNAKIARAYASLEQRSKPPSALIALNRSTRGPTRSGGLGWQKLLSSNDVSSENLSMMRTVAQRRVPVLVELGLSHLSPYRNRSDSDATVPLAPEDVEACLDALDEAIELSELLLEPNLALKLKRTYGGIFAYFADPTGTAHTPEDHLSAAWAAARFTDNRTRQSTLLNDLGIALSARGLHAVAVECFDDCIALARESGDDELVARGALNRFKASGKSAHRAQAEENIATLDPGHAKALMQLSVASAYADGGEHEPAYRNFKSALQIARTDADERLQSQALGLLGKLYLSQQRSQEALQLTRHALHLAQGETLRSDDLTFRWTWQVGKILSAQGEFSRALAAYERAEQLMVAIRRELVVGLGQRGGSANFRHELGPFYDELAEFYFSKARSASSGSETVAANLDRARGTMERFKAALLEDYFSDPGITTYRTQSLGSGRRLKPGEIEPDVPADRVVQLAGNTALIYLMPMPNRTEILLDLEEQRVWRTIDIDRDHVSSLSDQLRKQLDPLSGAKIETEAFKKPAQELYDHLIRPLEKFLDEDVQTLVIVADGKLRSIPMAVLHDGEQFLIEKYALATLPDLSLMRDDRKPRNRKKIGLDRPLLAGLSEPAQGFSGLPGVEGEINFLQNQFGGETALLDQDYNLNSFAAHLRDDDFNLVHIASHANFSTDLDDTFILTYEDRIGPQDLEASVRQLAFREQPVELLVLSACETAVGDDRAALGLAGIAVKSGAHSVMASLWAVDDRATQALVESFYRELLQPGRSKAAALQGAQRAVMKNPEWRHPQYWAPFTVIGNWLAPEERDRIYLVIEAERKQKLEGLEQ